MLTLNTARCGLSSRYIYANYVAFVSSWTWLYTR